VAVCAAGEALSGVSGEPADPEPNFEHAVAARPPATSEEAVPRNCRRG
jgi:hypothetical protein